MSELKFKVGDLVSVNAYVALNTWQWRDGEVVEVSKKDPFLLPYKVRYTSPFESHHENSVAEWFEEDEVRTRTPEEHPEPKFKVGDKVWPTDVTHPEDFDWEIEYGPFTSFGNVCYLVKGKSKYDNTFIKSVDVLAHREPPKFKVGEVYKTALFGVFRYTVVHVEEDGTGVGRYTPEGLDDYKYMPLKPCGVQNGVLIKIEEKDE